MPIVNGNKELVDIIDWHDLFSEAFKNNVNLDLPVVIMAGGKGTRLHPLTNIIPKPLIPVSDKTIIEEIMDKFVAVNCKNFYLSVNYLADTIQDYFARLNSSDYIVSYIRETEPRGTAGSLSLLRNKLNKTFFVSNCDILVDVNLGDLFEYHKNNKNTITVVSVLKNVSIPYGTIETGNDGVLTALTEKPTLTYQINSGLYILEPEVLSHINDNEYLHITDLIMRLNGYGKRTGVFPVSEGSWIDMGNWDDYLKIIKESKK
jgi:NDP-sugar pyrophosphorylase family protein